MINETYSAFVQGFLPTLARPDVDLLDGLTPAIIVDQERMGANARSTVGTATDANAMLRILFSRLGKPHIGSPNAYSFNVPSVKASGAITVERGAGRTTTEKATFNRLGGMCPRCEGVVPLHQRTRSDNGCRARTPAAHRVKTRGRVNIAAADGLVRRLSPALVQRLEGRRRKPRVQRPVGLQVWQREVMLARSVVPITRPKRPSLR